MKVLKTIAALLSRKERVYLLAIGAAMMVVGVGEMLGVASVLPFMQIMADPGSLQGDTWVADLYDRFGFASPEAALFASGLFLLGVITANNVFAAGTQWLMQRYAWGLNHRLSTDLLGSYLEQPYSFFLGRNTSELNRTLLAAVNSVVTGVIIPALQVAARSISALLIVVVLAAVNLRLALLLGVLFGGAYALVYLVVRRSQHRLGWEQFNNNGRRFLIAQEALAGIKDVKVLGREAEFMRRFAEPSHRYSVAAAHNQIVSRLPRYALETVAFGGILVVLLIAIRQQDDVTGLLPQLALYAFAGYRLMPALNELFASVITIRFNTAALETLHEDLTAKWNGAVREPSLTKDIDPVTVPSPAEAAPMVQFDRVTFRYPDAERPTLEEVSLVIEPKQVVGLVGSTGAGKTTVVDLILGLLDPTEGQIRVEGATLTEHNGAAWRVRCGYVPQEVFLSDDTIASNIAFGIPASEVDMEAVRVAARTAQIDAFISSLAEGYATPIGERGVRLSGGQRQRIGIARALYHDPDVLVMDEATNALDSVTESAVIDTIHRLARKKTLIVVAHRLSTVRDCDRIYVLDDGRVVGAGTFAELYKNDARFRAMVGEGA